ncbi:macrophage mannose receptor 1-like [Protopterus annectens]|uniref:macrophage mannose receptor 1-like n=1 Tax=Protopterus annectens TaxID=7888 RepID=UPI001CFA6A70|nr:macrophage mannose receptor 1-like [Protopterus annectens]
MPYYCEEREENNNSYFLVMTLKTWTAARDHCRAQQADLVSIRNETEFQMVKTIIGGYTVWIGLYWNSSTGQWQWADGSFTSYQNWENYQPDFYSGFEFCIHIVVKYYDLPFGLWNDCPCMTLQYFLCYEEISAEFYLIKEKKTFLEATFYCRMFYTDIVSVSYHETQRQVANVASNASDNEVWIGLRKHQNSGQWIWMNEDPVSYTNWDKQADSQASGDCVMLTRDKNFTWSKSCCSSRYEFICYN